MNCQTAIELLPWLLNALGLPVPTYGPLPMILGDDGARLSKRHGAVSVMQYKDEGYLPEALLNYLVRLGWSHGDQELFSIDEMIQLFELENVNKAPSSFNTDKLKWINQQYLKDDSPERVAHLLSMHLGNLGIDPAEDGPNLVEVVEAQRERAQTLKELAQVSRFYYQDFDQYNEKAAKKAFKAAAVEPLTVVRQYISDIQDWTRENLHSAIESTVEQLEIGFGKIGMPLRTAVTGGAPSPDLDLTLYLVGKEACLRRIDMAIEEINKRSAT